METVVYIPFCSFTAKMEEPSDVFLVANRRTRCANKQSASTK